ncbi:MAG TPA: TldD/PmbA family protein [Mycobacteriales bacterium]|nr:TldD/PmbA family protein [Mycobacteriales bacterium]
MELAELAELARDEAQRHGVEYADARAVQEDSESIDVRDDTVQGVGRATSRGVGVRVLAGGSWGFAATSDADEGQVRRAVERAVDIARASATVQRERVTLDDSPPPSGTYTTPHERDPFDVPLAEKVDHLLAAAAAGREAAGVSYVEATADAWRRRTAFRSTEGGWFDQTVLQVGGGMRALAIKAGDVQRRSYPNSFRGQYTGGGWEDVVALDLAGNALATATEAVALLDAPDLPAGQRTLILESSQLALQVHESVGHATELDRILGMERAYAGTSFVEVADRGHLQYGSPLVTITADATTQGAMGTFGYDDDGVAAGETTLIQDGLLVGFLTNRESAGAIGERSNGTARADSWSTIPLIRMNNVSLQPREGDLESIVADTDDGILLLTNKSWSIDDRRVNFQFACEAAYEIRGGQRGQLYKNPTYAGRTTDFWGSCDAVGGRDDWRVWGIPNCGKGQPGQVARVAHGAATGRFRGVTTGVGA